MISLSDNQGKFQMQNAFSSKPEEMDSQMDNVKHHLGGWITQRAFSEQNAMHCYKGTCTPQKFDLFP